LSSTRRPLNSLLYLSAQPLGRTFGPAVFSLVGHNALELHLNSPLNCFAFAFVCANSRTSFVSLRAFFILGQPMQNLREPTPVNNARHPPIMNKLAGIFNIAADATFFPPGRRSLTKLLSRARRRAQPSPS
jgi:hypothetical protein